MTYRPGWNEYFMKLAVGVSVRSTCLRRQVGAVLVDKRNHIIGTGYNGVYSGAPHCSYKAEESTNYIEVKPHYPHACDGAYEKSGEGLDSCEAIHAEQNALLQCKDVFSIRKIYTTTSPCTTCIKLLLSTSCKQIIFLEEYPDWDTVRLLWEDSGRRWLKLKL